MKRSRWVTIAFAVAVGLVLAALVTVGVGAYLFFSYVGIESATPTSVAREFDQARTRFSGQSALIDAAHERVNEELLDRAATVPTKLTAIRVLTFDPDSDRIARVTIPFWLFRMGKGTPRFDLSEVVGSSHVMISAADLERMGPALIVDHQDPDGTRVLVWTE